MGGAFDTTATSLEQPEAREHFKIRGFQQPECKPCCSFLGAFDTTATTLEQPEALEHSKYEGFSSPNANLVVLFGGL